MTGGKFVYADLEGSSHRAELSIVGPANFLIDSKKNIDPLQPVNQISQQQLVDELSRLLVDFCDDAQGGAAPIKTVIKVAERFPTADPRIAPDLIVGYSHNYRIGWQTPLGGIAKTPLEDNLAPWSGDHCVASELVPGMLLCNRPLHVEQPDLTDVGPTLLALCGVPVPEAMSGRPLIYVSCVVSRDGTRPVGRS